VCVGPPLAPLRQLDFLSGYLLELFLVWDGLARVLGTFGSWTLLSMIRSGRFQAIIHAHLPFASFL
jgi:hypothetical protein